VGSRVRMKVEAKKKIPCPYLESSSTLPTELTRFSGLSVAWLIFRDVINTVTDTLYILKY
jgi:hypothetical protein